MKEDKIKYFKLGLFVFLGLFFLVGFLYLIGKNKNIFGSNYILKTRFSNVQGLKTGNNVRFAGIEIGTVSNMKFINDTMIEVEMHVEEKMRGIIRKNSIVTIGTDGLVGNKIVNISASDFDGEFAKENEMLKSRKPLDSEELLLTLENTGKDLNAMVTNLKITSLEIRNSKMLKEILQDESLAKNLKKSAAYVSSFSKEINESAVKLNKMISNMENGKGVLGKLYMDTSWVNATDMFIMNLRKGSDELTSTSLYLKDMVSQMREETLNGDGVLHQILKNEEWTYQIDSILVNTKQGSDNINQLAIALQKHFLFRRYFRKMTKSEKK
jgi:phospholipid/cholesterol/gamma-HCH transport system substrate-binding protein